MDPAILNKLDAFFAQGKPQHFKRGGILIRAGDNPPGIFSIKSGIVRQYAISKKGDDMVVNIFKPHAFFPMSWAMNNTPNNYFFDGMTEVDALRVSKEAAQDFIKSNPDVLYDLLSRVYSGTDGLLMRMMYLMSGDAYTRLVAELVIQAKRLGRKANAGSSLEVLISEKELAAQSGMTRETVSRAMKMLRDRGLVLFTASTLVIKDLGKLEDELK